YDELDRVAAQVAVAVLEPDAEALARGEPALRVHVLGHALGDRHHDHLLLGGDVGVLERHGDAREGAKGLDLLLGPTRRAAPVQVPWREGEALADQALPGATRPAHDDL